MYCTSRSAAALDEEGDRWRSLKLQSTCGLHTAPGGCRREYNVAGGNVNGQKTMERKTRMRKRKLGQKMQADQTCSGRRGARRVEGSSHRFLRGLSPVAFLPPFW